MEYSSRKPKLIIPEYGRHIQMLVEKAVDIEDRDERNRFAGGIIDLMGEMYPYLRDVNDFKHKLWTHLALMSDFKLDIDSPYDKPEREKIYERPPKLPYPQKRMKYRYYGRTIVSIIDQAAEMEDSEQKNALILTVANHMKKQYLAWNKDIVDDSIIIRDLGILSENRINLPENYKLAETRNLKQKNYSKSKNSPGKKKMSKSGKGVKSKRK